MSQRRLGAFVSVGSAACGFAMALILASLLLSVSTTSSVRAAQTVTVNIGDNYFLPQTTTINVGDTVVFYNSGGTTHTATSPGNFDSMDIMPGASYNFTFTTSGEFSYYCTYHPDMTGTIIVQQPAPEFPGFLALATVGLAVFLGLALERALRLQGLK
ncbi:MAG: cupredoxin domain-containing protein [Conexivisphaerales archaeon]|jgi:plastocyanin